MNCILAVLGTVIMMDGIGSLFWYHKKEGKPNQAFRAVRVAVGVTIIIIALRMGI